ncbi:MAG TPA: AtpZ/AtpI family protein [Candidatus Obscuribacterales bacterium]
MPYQDNEPESDDWPARKPGRPVKVTRPIVSIDAAYKMVGPVVMGLMIGFFLDNFFHTQPWGLLGMTLFGMITGFYSLLKPLFFPSKPAETAEAELPKSDQRSE